MCGVAACPVKDIGFGRRGIIRAAHPAQRAFDLEGMMNWKQKIVVRILFLIAKMFSEEETLRKDLESLSNHINYAEQHPQLQ